MRRTASEVIRTLENRVARLERESGIIDRVKDFFTDKPTAKVPGVWVEQEAYSGRRGTVYWVATNDPKQILGMLKSTTLRVRGSEKYNGLTFIMLGNVSGLNADQSTKSLVDALKFDHGDHVYRKDKQSPEEISPDMVMEAKKLLKR